MRTLWHILLILSMTALAAFAAFGQAAPSNTLTNSTTGTSSSAPANRVVEIAGTVEFQTSGSATWVTATNGLGLNPGDRIRTRSQSRAAIQLSDRSVLRLNEQTTLEIQPPRSAEKRRFRLPFGSLFFFNREKPADVEFETPVVSGAIRGTEFVLETSAANGATRLSLLDGAVELTTPNATLALQSGEAAQIDPGQPPVKSPLLEIPSLVQWAVYYPAVLHPADLALSDDEKVTLAQVLSAYQSGDLLSAHAAMSGIPAGGSERELVRAALDLAVGRADLADAILAASPNSPAARALRELIHVTRGDTRALESSQPTTSSEWLARSYSLQSQFALSEARAAAWKAVRLSPQFGFAYVRWAELEMATEHPRAAKEALRHALELSPRNAQAHSLRGFAALEEIDPRAALVAFDRAIEIDAALGNAWLGRGLAQLRVGQRDEALRSFQTAAALEPRRALARSYLGKAFSAAGEARLAEKDFRLAKALDPGDPTAFLYSALHLWQQNRPNAAVRDLEQSVALNDNRQVFQSRLGLDRDRAVRSADLAALYAEAGLPEVSLRSATRSVNDDYANFSGHLFLANSYQALENPNRFDLRLENARFSELLVANLLAPAGAGNLSQLFSQQQHLQYFDPRPFGASSLTEYRSDGDWRQLATFFGSVDGFSYAVDVAYDSQHGQEINDWRERKDVSVQLKQRLGPLDEVYFQAAWSDGEAGDVARHYDPADAIRGFHVSEQQSPNLFAGWHHAWSPASHTLVLVSRLTDSLDLLNPETSVLHFRTNSGGVQQVYAYNDNSSRFASDFVLHSAELQQLWQRDAHTVIAGGRFQEGSVESDGVLTKYFTGVLDRGHIDETLRRANGYLYYHWQIVEPLRLIGGLSYDHLIYPKNADLLPLTKGTDSKDLLEPKAGFILTPWHNAQWRGAYTKSLGGLYFDNSVRLEPSQVAGFNQSFRSLAPESTVGLVPGTEFETLNLGFDQALPGGTYFGLGTEWLHSDGERTVGVTAAPFPPPTPGSGASTRQVLEYRERNFSAYAVQLLGDGFSVGARYRLSAADLHTRLPEVANSAVDLEAQEADQRATLHQVALSLNYQHPGGLFGQWESAWYHQENAGQSLADGDDSFWQHNVWVGWRFPQRRAEVRVGALNLTETDYRLNPLNLYNPLPRGRAVVLSLRLNF